MSIHCELNIDKKVKKGHKVSHSNRKTKRTFTPNSQHVTLFSEVLNKEFQFRISTGSLRSVEHNGGLDGYLLSTSSSKLGARAQRVKKQLKLQKKPD